MCDDKYLRQLIFCVAIILISFSAFIVFDMPVGAKITALILMWLSAIKISLLLK